MERIMNIKKDISGKPKGINHNHFGPLQRYGIECYKCNNFGHMARECKLRKSVSVEVKKQWKKMEVVKKEDQRFPIYKGKLYGYCYCYHMFGHKAADCRTKGKYQNLRRKQYTNTKDDKGQEGYLMGIYGRKSQIMRNQKKDKFQTSVRSPKMMMSIIVP